MTVIRPNSISGVTSITAQSQSIEFYKSDGNLSGANLDGVNINTAGILTAANFKTGSSNLHSTGLTVGNNFLHTTGINVGTGATIHVPSSNVLTLGTNSNERVRIGSSGQIGLSGANYGSSGQVLTSQGSGSAATWSTVSGTTINNNADNRVITGSGTANTLEGESSLTYNSGYLFINESAGSSADGAKIKLKYSNNDDTDVISTIVFGNNLAEVAKIKGETRNGNTNGMITFHTTISGSESEKMRINHDGAFCFGSDLARPAEFYQPDGFSIRWDDKGQFQNSVSNTTGGYMNRKGSDGGILSFARQGTYVGEIGVNASTMYLNFGGTNAAAHQLDDYEEGTWTPTLVNAPGGASIYSATGYYTKVGNMCTIWLQGPTIAGNNSSNNTIQIGGIPFSCASGFVATGIPRGYGVYRNSNHTWVTMLDSGNNIMWGQLDENVSWTMLKYSGLQNTSGHVTFQITLTYKTT